jgi:hypothetical protein
VDELPDACLRAARTCDAVLAALARYPGRDAAIERLEHAIDRERRTALARADAGAEGRPLPPPSVAPPVR